MKLYDKKTQVQRFPRQTPKDTSRKNGEKPPKEEGIRGDTKKKVALFTISNSKRFS